MSVKSSTSHPDVVAAATIAELTTPSRDQRLDLVRRLGTFRRALGELPHTKSEIGRAEAKVRAIREGGFDIACLTDPRYPRLLRVAPDPPFLLSVWGQLEEEDALGLAIVGSRRATRYGLEMSRRLGSSLASAGLTIVSGLARGIDAAAHRGALDVRGRTIAVLGSGLRNIYPREHRGLALRIAEHGAVISELDLDEPPRAGNFPRRNRIITGMTLGTLVVEATLRSGSLISARLAMEQDREVYAVPGPALSPNSEGAHALIRDGAKLVTTVDDVLEELRPDIRALLNTRAKATTSSRDEALDDTERSILEHLVEIQEAVHLDTLLDHVDVSVDRAMAALCNLEVKGRIWSLEGGRYQAVP